MSYRDAVIIGLSGYAQSGKDSTAKVLVEKYGYRRLAFADALKAVLYDLNPLTEDADQTGLMSDLQVLVDSHGWEWTKANSQARAYLQRLGVAVREHVGQDAWCDAVMRQIQRGDKVVITDVRFPNEYEAINSAGGSVWRLIRAGNAPVNPHVSETALDDKYFDRHLTLPDYNDDLERLDEALTELVAIALQRWVA